MLRYIYIYIYTYMCVCVHIHIYIYIYSHCLSCILSNAKYVLPKWPSSGTSNKIIIDNYLCVNVKLVLRTRSLFHGK